MDDGNGYMRSRDFAGQHRLAPEGLFRKAVFRPFEKRPGLGRRARIRDRFRMSLAGIAMAMAMAIGMLIAIQIGMGLRPVVMRGWMEYMRKRRAEGFIDQAAIEKLAGEEEKGDEEGDAGEQAARPEKGNGDAHEPFLTGKKYIPGPS